ncbi:hypothetical protein [Paenibacillus sp. UNC451MF]|uniref:hypothetical protein n=1 Tax=Paenibacillus sp. UNC451MF TaxID=1449063 RepID=UPI000A454057|nr:hypothetical protein [Paenibacillus sp. UNC451MF]
MEHLKSVDIEKKNIEQKVEQKYDKGLVASTFIKYAAYIVIFFGFLYFIVRYIFPMFR